MTEFILIITLGLYNGEAVEMEVLEYKQPSMEVCEQQQKRIAESRDGAFNYYALCASRVNRDMPIINR